MECVLSVYCLFVQDEWEIRSGLFIRLEAQMIWKCIIPSRWQNYLNGMKFWETQITSRNRPRRVSDCSNWYPKKKVTNYRIFRFAEINCTPPQYAKLSSIVSRCMLCVLHIRNIRTLTSRIAAEWICVFALYSFARTANRNFIYEELRRKFDN